MSIDPVLYSSRSEEWPTPQNFFDALNAEFQFTLDPCATPENAKCSNFYTKHENGLEKDRGTHRVFCNPPPLWHNWISGIYWTEGFDSYPPEKCAKL